MDRLRTERAVIVRAPSFPGAGALVIHSMTIACSRQLALATVAAACLAGMPAAAQTGSLRRAVRTEDGVVQVRARVQGPDLIRTARRYLGVRYALGGASPKAFDCSGFVRYVFDQHGIWMPRTAKEQAAYGQAPMPGDLQPGDLLFFYGGSGAQHIALYVGGDTIIHASSSGRRVKLDRFGGTRARPTWFGRRLIAVRRVLPAEGVLTLPMTASSPGRRAAPAVEASMLLSAPPAIY